MKMNAEIDCFHNFVFFENVYYIILYEHPAKTLLKM